MPRLIHATPKYRHHKASGQAVVTVNGRDHYLGRWNTKASKAEYDRLIAEHLAANRQAPPTGSDGLTISELVARYWHFARGYYIKNGRPTGVLPGIKVTLRLLRRCYGHTAAVDFGPLALKAVRSKMVEAGNSRPYINNNVAHIKRMFRWAVSEELVPETVHRALATVPGNLLSIPKPRSYNRAFFIPSDTFFNRPPPRFSTGVYSAIAPTSAS